VLLRHLPPESAYATATRESLTDEQLAEATEQHAGKHGPWARQDYLLAGVLDALHQLIWVQVSKSGVKNLPPPKPLPRPGLSAASRVDPKAIAHLEELRERHRREAVTSNV
jgi:hypothetical protein